MNNYYQHVIFDLDSTLCRIEGVDELARSKGCIQEVTQITRLAMEGQLAFREALQRRLEVIRPTHPELVQLSRQYIQELTNGARETVQILLEKGSQVYIVSGGYTQAVLSVQKELQLPQTHLYSIDLRFDENGNYQTFDQANVLCEPQGKTTVIDRLRQQFPEQTFAMVGDGLSDYETSEVVDRFICFAGVTQRPTVIEKSKWIVTEPDLRAVLPFLIE